MTSTSPISVPSDILNECALEQWKTLTPERREGIATSLSQALVAAGYAFTQWRVEMHGPSAEQPVLIFTDAHSRLDFALIPGGTLLPGYDDAQLERYNRIHTIAERRDDEDEEWEEVEIQKQPLDQPRIFASKAPCDLRRKPPASIAPFLMAITPVLAETPEITEVVTMPHWWRETWEEMQADHIPVQLRWGMVAPVLERYRWDVPTSQEWEWASQGGTSGIFYWGDEVPRFVVNPIAYYADESDEKEVEEYAQYELEKDAQIALAWPMEERELITDAVRFEDVMGECFFPDMTHLWPRVNRFGLVGLLAWSEWCAPSNDLSDPHPLISRGGAAGCFPWQACGEWMLLLRAVESRLSIDTDYGNWKTLRPILRLR